MAEKFGTNVYAPVVAGADTADDMAVAYGDELGRTIHHFLTISDRDSFSSSFKSRLYRSWCVVKSDDNGFAQWYEWDGTQEDGSDGKWAELNISGVVMSDSSGAIPKNIKTVVFGPNFSIEQAGDQEDAALVTYTGTGGGSSLSLGMAYHPYTIVNDINEIEVYYPLEVDTAQSGPNQPIAGVASLSLKPDIYEPMHKPSFLAYIAESKEITGKTYHTDNKGHHDGSIWFDNVIWPAGAYIETDKPNKAYGIEEADQLDPNVSGGTDYLIAFRVALKGNAPEDGIVRVYLYDKSVDPFEPTGYLKDVNDQVMGFQKSYKSDEKLGVIEVVGVVNAKGLQSFSCHVLDSFQSDALSLEDRTDGGTCLMIQAITSEGKTGDGLQQFEIDTQQNIEFSSHYLGVDRMSLGFIISRLQAPVSFTAGTNFVATDGYRLINPNGIKVGTVDDHVLIQDDGVHIADFNFGRIFSAEETQMLVGKTINVTSTLIDKDNAYEVALMSWTGKPDEYTPEIFTTRTNNIPSFQAGWIKGDNYFISEDAVLGDHTQSETFTIPSDANNYAIIIYPVEAQLPTTLKLKEFNVDVEPAFIGYAIKAPELVGEAHLYESEKYKELVQDNQGYASLRYAINNTQSPMPVGVPLLGKGKADISIDPSINQVPESNAKGGDGVLVFNQDGQASISSTYKVFSDESVQDGIKSNVRFWWSRVEAGNQFVEIPNSSVEVQVTGGDTIAMDVTIPAFIIDVEDGDKIAAFAQADIADGAFVQCHDSRSPIVRNTIDFKELFADSGDTTDLINAGMTKALIVDRRIYSFGSNTEQNIVINLDIPADVDLADIEVVNIDGSIVSSVNSREYSYDSSNQALTVHVGPNVTEGKIYLTFWG